MCIRDSLRFCSSVLFRLLPFRLSSFLRFLQRIFPFNTATLTFNMFSLYVLSIYCICSFYFVLPPFRALSEDMLASKINMLYYIYCVIFTWHSGLTSCILLCTKIWKIFTTGRYSKIVLITALHLSLIHI